MNPRLRKKMVTDAIWLGGAALFCVALVGSALRALDASKSEVQDLRAALAGKERRLATEVEADRQVAALDRAQDRLTASQRAIDSDAERVSHLSRVAREAGVQLVRMRAGASRVSEDGLVVAKTHRLSVLGGYRELAVFLDGVHAAAGIVGIDRLEIEPEVIEPDGATSGQLRASLEVAWFGQARQGEEG